MATILPENQINQEFNSSVHQFFRDQKLGTLLNQSNTNTKMICYSKLYRNLYFL